LNRPFRNGRGLNTNYIYFFLDARDENNVGSSVYVVFDSNGNNITVAPGVNSPVQPPLVTPIPMAFTPGAYTGLQPIPVPTPVPGVPTPTPRPTPKPSTTPKGSAASLRPSTWLLVLLVLLVALLSLRPTST